MPLSRTRLTAAALAVAAAAPSAAHAAEGFTGITTTGRVAHFQSDSVPGMDSAPVKVTGLAAGERVVGLDRTPAGELLALTSAGKLDSLDADTGKATAKFQAPVTAPVRSRMTRRSRRARSGAACCTATSTTGVRSTARSA